MATSDGNGNYVVSGIEPGRYRVSVERAGFVDQQYGAKGPSQAGSFLTLEKSQRARDITIKMTPQGVIAGRVMDDDGDPVANATIQVLKRTYVRGRKQLVPVDNASTNDLGEYRVYGLPPGRYIVNANARRMFRGGMVQDTDQDAFAPTFYPAGASPDMAAPIEVAAGAQFRGIDVRLRKTRTVRVQGRVTGGTTTAGNRGGGGTSVSLVPKDGGGGFGMRNSSRPYNAQGEFLLNNVVPGSYILTASQFEGGKTLFARMPIEVGNSPIEGLSLQLAPGADLRGRVKVEGSDTQTGSMRVNLVGRPGAVFGQGAGVQGGAMNPDGTFVLSNVQPENYDVRVSSVPDGGYVKSIRLGEADVTDSGLDFTNGVMAGEMTVSVAMTAAQVEGTVQNDKSEPASGVTVVLVPEGPRKESDRYYSVTSTDQTGHFTLKNLTPGEYRVYSFDNIENGAYMDPEWMLPYQGKGERVSLKDSGHETVTLKLVVAQGV